MSALMNVPYCGKLSREKTLANFTVLWLFAKVFSMKFGGLPSFDSAKASNLRKFSPQKLYFSLESFPLYSISWSAINITHKGWNNCLGNPSLVPRSCPAFCHLQHSTEILFMHRECLGTRLTGHRYRSLYHSD